jgi:hypothetical protein
MNLKRIQHLVRKIYRALLVGNRTQRAAYVAEHLYRNPRYDDPRRLSRQEFRAFSQGGEDGILLEIFRRIGTATKTFVEVGLEDGLECNTRHLLAMGWTGLWIEGSPRCTALIRQHFVNELGSGNLRLEEYFVQPYNFDNLIQTAGLPLEFDLLSIDVDSIDFWLWKGVQQHRPRVVVMEYNARIPPGIDWTLALDGSNKTYPGGGASLDALSRLGREKGYTLVGCGFTGCNAFWVRDDLVGDEFCADSSVACHFEPLRDFLIEPHIVV